MQITVEEIKKTKKKSKNSFGWRDLLQIHSCSVAGYYFASNSWNQYYIYSGMEIIFLFLGGHANSGIVSIATSQAMFGWV